MAHHPQPIKTQQHQSLLLRLRLDPRLRQRPEVTPGASVTIKLQVAEAMVAARPHLRCYRGQWQLLRAAHQGAVPLQHQSQ